MKPIDLDKIESDMNTQGFSIIREYLDADEIETSTELCDLLTDMYTEEGVLDRLFFKREETRNRQGDAVMVSMERTQELSSIPLNSELLQDHYDILGRLTGVEVPKNSRIMMNMQRYFNESYEVVNHYDGMFMKFHHGEADEYGEKPLIIEEGLIPNFVQVVVLENENEGKGVYVINEETDNKRVDILLHPGDLLIFNNIKMRHGVPPLSKPRRMMGFRNYDHMPLYFSSTEFEGSKELPDNINPGFIKEISSEESIELQKEELKEWKAGKGKEQLKKPAAF